MKSALRKDSRGIAAVEIIVAVVVVAVLAGVGFYVYKSRSDKEGASSGQNIVSQETKDACEKLLNDKDFCKFAGNFTFTEQYKMTIAVNGPDNNGVTTIETDGKGNSSMVMIQDGQEVSAHIIYNNASYSKSAGEDVWLKYESAETNPIDAFDISESLNVAFEGESSLPESQRVKYNKLGKEACGSYNCFKYEITDPTLPDLTQYIWFDDKDYRLRKWTSVEEGTTTEITVSYETVTISEPSPVEEISLDVPSEAELQRMMEQFQQ